ncbi:MAG: hypothetical protein ACR2KQ_06680 [Actinomycetota bacterium]
MNFPIARWLLAILVVLLVSAGCSEDPAPDAVSPTPVEITGTFTGKISKQELRELDNVPPYWAGTWRLEMDAGSYTLSHEDFRFTEAFDVADEGLRISATPAPAGAFNCFNDAEERLTGEGDAAAVYRYSLTETSIELAASEEPCPLREALLERTWTLAP